MAASTNGFLLFMSFFNVSSPNVYGDIFLHKRAHDKCSFSSHLLFFSNNCVQYCCSSVVDAEMCTQKTAQKPNSVFNALWQNMGRDCMQGTHTYVC